MNFAYQLHTLFSFQRFNYLTEEAFQSRIQIVITQYFNEITCLILVQENVSIDSHFHSEKKVLLKFEGFLQLNRMTMLQFGSLIEIFLHNLHLQIEIEALFFAIGNML